MLMSDQPIYSVFTRSFINTLIKLGDGERGLEKQQGEGGR